MSKDINIGIPNSPHRWYARTCYEHNHDYLVFDIPGIVPPVFSGQCPDCEAERIKGLEKIGAL